ncbi:zinc finger protein 84-like isoform X2 [Agrilus planipennis]|uniref:Zinc finger protein 84-like isoform X2 n=1 Tax=Agrilus planipennis TaxID=224129 RepID=A0A1W4W2T7_AGRPL|nr:zinc finger protein 84-like isoform X2 [Agrilus planipennis]
MSLDILININACSYVRNMEQVQIKCSVCDKEFSQRKSVYVHLRNVHKIERLVPELIHPAFDCGNCNKKFLYKTCLVRHIKSCFSSENKNNKSCLRVLTPGNRLICPQEDCGEKFLKYVNLRQHLMVQHDTNIEFEDLTFNSTSDFKKWKDQVEQETQSHYTLDTGLRPLINGTSKKTYNCHRSYTKRGKSKNIRTYLTTKMGRACPSRIEVIFENDEQSTLSVKFWKTHCGHTDKIGRVNCNEFGGGRIKCEVCKKIFFMRPHFEAHLCKGKAKSKIPCPNCEKTFSSTYNLRRHLHCHLKIKPFECHTCKKRFPHIYNLTRHLLTHHTNDKPFKCKVCSKSYLQADILEEHTKSCRKPFKCDHCEKTFTRKYSVFVHINCVHKRDPKVSDSAKVTGTSNITTENTVRPVEVKTEEIFTAINEPLVKFEATSVELSEIIVPKEELKEEYCEIGENSAEAFAYLTAEIDQDPEAYKVKEESIEF